MEEALKYPDDFRFPVIDVDHINWLVQEVLDARAEGPGIRQIIDGDLAAEWDASLGLVRVWRLVATASLGKTHEQA